MTPHRLTDILIAALSLPTVTTPPDDLGTESSDQESDPLSRLFGPNAPDIPAAIEPVHPFTAVGEPITLHKSPMTLLYKVDENSSFDDPTTQSVEVDGQLTFTLLPNTDFVIRCTTEDNRLGPNLLPPSQHKFGLMLPGQTNVLPILPIHTSLFPPYGLEAIVNEEPDPLVPEEVLEIQFYLVNFSLGHGNIAVRYDKSIAFNRINLQMDDEWLIDIDSRQDFNNIWKQTTAQRSFTFTHVGRIKRKGEETFDFAKAESKLGILFWFLSFLRGSPVGVGPIFAISHTSTPILLFRHPTVVYSAKDTLSWFPRLETDNLNTLYSEFHKTIELPIWNEVLPQLVSSQGSVSEGYVESRLSTACSALETMAWMRLVQDQEQLSRSKYNKLNAGDRLQLLLESCSIGIEVPEELTELARKAHQEQMKCPTVIQWVRNRVVHPDRNSQLTTELKIEASHAAIWYLELTLLHLFKYKGQYENRISQKTELVPWANQFAADTADNTHE